MESYHLLQEIGKMNKTVGEALDLIRQLKVSIPRLKGWRWLLPRLSPLSMQSKKSFKTTICLAAQNLSMKRRGLYRRGFSSDA